MADFSVAGLGSGSGLKLDELVESLVVVEGETAALNLDTRETAAQAKISGFGLLNSALSDLDSKLAVLKDAEDFQKRTATSSDTATITASAATGASTGSYTIDSITTLAAAHKLKSAAFTNTTTVVGTGTLTITNADSDTFSITVTSSNDELGQIRDAINDASDNFGVSATIVTSDAGAELILTADDTGTGHALTVTVTNDGDSNNTDNSGLSQLVNTYLTTQQAAAQAVFSVEGQTVTSSSNTINTAIDGVTLTLLATDASSNTITVTTDTSATKTAVTDFVTSYNSLMTTVNDLEKYDTSTGSTGLLFGDATLRNIIADIRGVINNSVTGLTGNFTYLSDIGVRLTDDLDGKLEVDSTTLDTAIVSNYEDIRKVFSTTTHGIATKLSSIIGNYQNTSDGIITTQLSTLNDEVADINQERLDLVDYLEDYEERLQYKFTQMDLLVTQLEGIKDFLTIQLDALPGFTKPQ